jgi:hypothetical protein
LRLVKRLLRAGYRGIKDGQYPLPPNGLCSFLQRRQTHRLAFYKDFLPYCALAALLVRLGLVAASLMPDGYAWTDAGRWLIDDKKRVMDVAQRMYSRSRILVSK